MLITNLDYQYSLNNNIVLSIFISPGGYYSKVLIVIICVTGVTGNNFFSSFISVFLNFFKVKKLQIYKKLIKIPLKLEYKYM